MEFDRTTFVPPHTGDNVLPLNPFFQRLVRHAHRKPQRLAIRDVNLGLEKTYLEFLTDILSVRKTIKSRLAPETLTSLQSGKEVYIGLLAQSGYEYAVAFVAIAALGAAVVPMTVVLPVQEAVYFVTKARCAAVLVSNAAANLGEALVDHVNKSNKDRSIGCIQIASGFAKETISASDIQICSDRLSDENSPGLVIFTSGTTGPPKGVVMRRTFMHDNSMSNADHYKITENDVLLHVLPVHHATGIGINFLPYIISGACIEFRSGGFDVAWTWERIKRGGLTVFSGVPTIYMRMMRYFEQRIATLPREEKEEYIAGARQFRLMICGTSALPTPVQQFWKQILGGRGIVTRYGATEIGSTFQSPVDADVPEGSVGPAFPGITVKLSEGEEGELLVKSPFMFSKYIFDENATANAHDADGFFKTGDLARREGENYFILGRASLDILKSGGYKISALDIEREILGLPYVSEVMVVGVSDDEYGQRVAAAISLREDQNAYQCEKNGLSGRPFTLEDLRRDLRSKLAGYKMPTLLRVMEGELPKNGTGKVVKKVLGPKYFPPDYRRDPNVQVWSGSKSQDNSRL